MLPRILIVVVALTACTERQESQQTYFEVPGLDMRLPRLSGWQRDKSLDPSAQGEGGLAIRLVRSANVPLAPRIQVFLGPAAPSPDQLDELLRENLNDMQRYQEKGVFRITAMGQRPIRIGPRRGYRLKHEYTVDPDGNEAPVAVVQETVLFILEGRGVAVTAAGRAELYQPLAQSIDRILNGIQVVIPRNEVPERAKPEKKNENESLEGDLPPNIEPIDLGKVGGER